MAEDLSVYEDLNHHKSTDKPNDGFVEFLYQNTEMDAPDVDVDLAWENLKNRANPAKTFNWMKIAAAVSILAVFTASFFIYTFNSSTTQLQVSSLEEKVTVTFPDGSVGILNANSSFSYPEKFGEERNVSFTGEAYFDIQKSDKPFIIDVNGVDVTVLGTAFNLISSNDEVTLYVDRGLVAFEKDGEQTKVKAGKEAVFNRADASVIINDIPSDNIMSWRNGVFTFDQTPLPEALSQLGEFYEVDFKLSNNQLEACRISATFDNQSLKDVLQTIGAVLNVKTTLKDNTVKISGKGC